MQGGCPLRIPCASPAQCSGVRTGVRARHPLASPAQCSGVRTGVRARHGEPVGDHSDGGNFVGYHNTAGLRVGRGQPVRVTNRDADHAGTCGRKVGVPEVGVPEVGVPFRKVGVPFRKNLLILRMILV